jgi:hypothetical protein
VKVRDNLAKLVFNVPIEKIRVISPDVGGGFGLRGKLFPESAMVLWAARKLGRPVKWRAGRTETFLSDPHGRDHVTHAEMAFDENAKAIGVRIRTLAAMGAYLLDFGPRVPTIHEDGKFGDQKYLDSGPQMFADDVHIYQQPWNTLAPWNVEWWYGQKTVELAEGPIFYHFHGLRIYRQKICCFQHYTIRNNGPLSIYFAYIRALRPTLTYLGAEFRSKLPNWPPNHKSTTMGSLKTSIKNSYYSYMKRMLVTDWPTDKFASFQIKNT